MLNQERLQKLGLGIAALTMAATLINCSPDTSGLGMGQPVALNENFWCTEYTGAEAYGYVTYDEQSDFADAEEPYLFQINDGLGCYCFNDGMANNLIPHLTLPYTSGDPVIVPSDGSLANWVRDTVHEVARENCDYTGRYKAADISQEDLEDGWFDSEDIESFFSNCYGDDPSDVNDPDDIVKGPTTAIWSVYAPRCDPEFYGPYYGENSRASQPGITVANSTPSNRTSANIVFDREEIMELASNLTGLIVEQGIQLIPSSDGDGFMIYAPDQNDLLQSANLRHLDRLNTVNGKSVKTARQGFEAYNTFKNADTIRLVLTTHDGAKITNVYTFK